MHTIKCKSKLQVNTKCLINDFVKNFELKMNWSNESFCFDYKTNKMITCNFFVYIQNV